MAIGSKSLIINKEKNRCDSWHSNGNSSVMKGLFRNIVNFIRKEWFLLLAAAVIGLIIYIFERA